MSSGDGAGAAAAAAAPAAAAAGSLDAAGIWSEAEAALPAEVAGLTAEQIRQRDAEWLYPLGAPDEVLAAHAAAAAVDAQCDHA